MEETPINYSLGVTSTIYCGKFTAIPQLCGSMNRFGWQNQQDQGFLQQRIFGFPVGLP
jgi:hypothetical protein